MGTRIFVVTLLFLGFITQVQSYDVVDRYKLLSDKFQTERMMRPIGHDFFLDLTAGLNTNLLDIIDDAKDVANTAGSTTDKVNAAQTFLQQYNNSEQTIDVNLGLGFLCLASRQEE